MDSCGRILSLWLISFYLINVFCRPMSDKGSLSGLLTVDCEDQQLMRSLRAYGQQFRCQEISNEELFSTNLDAAFNLCPDPDTIYDPKLGKCFYIKKTSPNVHPSSRICKGGYSFSWEKMKCIRIKKFSFIDSNFNQDSYNMFSTDCERGSIYVPEVGVCLPVNPPDVHAKPQNTEPVVVQIGTFSTKCPKGSVYSSEIDLCLPVVNEPKREQQSSRPESFSLVLESKPFKGYNDGIQSHKKKCGPGMVYISEIDHCTHFNNERPLGDAPAKVTSEKKPIELTPSTPDPFRLTLAPLTGTNIHKTICQPGTFYLSELDICIEYEAPK